MGQPGYPDPLQRLGHGGLVVGGSLLSVLGFVIASSSSARGRRGTARRSARSSHPPADQSGTASAARPRPNVPGRQPLPTPRRARLSGSPGLSGSTRHASDQPDKVVGPTTDIAPHTRSTVATTSVLTPTVRWPRPLVTSSPSGILVICRLRANARANFRLVDCRLQIGRILERRGARSALAQSFRETLY
jgi:hypothetical protein